MHFKNTDVRWGAGEGRLPSIAVDENFYDLNTRVTLIEQNPPLPISVDHVAWDSVNNTITVVLTDGYSFGPFTLPAAKFTVVPWQPFTTYATNTFVTNDGNTYLVEYPHTSAATFDPGANDGLGHNYYGLLPFPNPPLISWLEEGWQPNVNMLAFKVFSRTDEGVFMSLATHVTAGTFDENATDNLNNPLYLKIFEAIETAIARIQFQYPGKPPSDGSAILVYINDDDRDLTFDGDWVGNYAHLNVACTGEIAWTMVIDGNTIGTITFSPGELLDGDGGQFGVFDGDGGTFANGELLRVFAPDYADASASFLTLAIRGAYVEPS